MIFNKDEEINQFMQKRNFPTKIDNDKGIASNGLIVWSLKIKRIENNLKKFLNDPIFCANWLNIKIEIFVQTLEFLWIIYVSIIPSRKRFPQFINDIAFLKTFTMKTCDEILLEFSLFLIENLENARNFDNFFKIEESISNLLKIWIILKNLCLFHFLIASKSGVLNLFMNDCIKEKKMFLIKKKTSFFSHDGNIEMNSTESFKEIINIFYLKFLKLISENGNLIIFDIL